ncbi:MAG: hypothetical protein A4E74_01544 [Syntrophus sp. PtaB.Bin075]|nr:MAG: hypothetical protein A4E74_01544 [Syntrophus sp. PtaB.Bin075]
MLSPDLPIALPCNYLIDYDDPVGIDLDQTAADVAVFVIPFKCEVVLAELAISETCAGTTPGQVDFDLRPTIGSDTDRGAADIAHFAMGTTAAGKVLYDKVAQGTILYPGEEVVCEIKVQPVTNPAGHFRPVLLVRYLPETLANLSDMVETA